MICSNVRTLDLLFENLHLKRKADFVLGWKILHWQHNLKDVYESERFRKSNAALIKAGSRSRSQHTIRASQHLLMVQRTVLLCGTILQLPQTTGSVLLAGKWFRCLAHEWAGILSLLPSGIPHRCVTETEGVLTLDHLDCIQACVVVSPLYSAQARLEKVCSCTVCLLTHEHVNATRTWEYIRVPPLFPPISANINCRILRYTRECETPNKPQSQ